MDEFPTPPFQTPRDKEKVLKNLRSWGLVGTVTKSLYFSNGNTSNQQAARNNLENHEGKFSTPFYTLLNQVQKQKKKIFVFLIP